MAAKRGEARQRILECAEALVRQIGAEAMSIEAVAKDAGSAKGLVHYHFKNKVGLLSAVAERVAESRRAHWKSAFSAPTAHDVVSQTWKLLTTESGNGTLRAWQSLVGSEGVLVDGLPNRLREQFSADLLTTLTTMLKDELGLEPTVPNSEIGMLLDAIIAGMEFHLTAGADEELCEAAFSAGWLAVLSLTRAAS